MIIGIIPARYGSTRFEGKPLIDIQGVTMIRRVYEQASKAKCLDKVIIATDDSRIFDHVQAFGAEVVMTLPNHPSGTDRCWEAYQSLVVDHWSLVENQPNSQFSIPNSQNYIINIQGDEPFIEPEQIDELGAMLDGSVELATQMIAVDNSDVLWDIGEVKIVLNDQHEALYFSRQVIPFLKNVQQTDWHLHLPYFRHVGMYAYRADILQKLTELPPSLLEKAESLEQLRWLEAGFKIKCVTTQYDSHCIDTPEDIDKVLKLVAGH
jgi:3-deoxy-manno-octulosonate cytidylyltransferase (CMP-KDO synthetase)